jgi:hypothetical protein
MAFTGTKVVEVRAYDGRSVLNLFFFPLHAGDQTCSTTGSHRQPQSFGGAFELRASYFLC